ncbi:MAG: ATP-dependent metallopeptidase FtsH/Yme1/Tma family protein, partial [Deltaproteobacteria bacterium]|nr:ATP-dependent metallopeptidase FtsH/Yme1/Tma family protein [Deltaproteobacteria bacterium]
MRPFYKNLVLWLVISFVLILLFNIFNQPHKSSQEINYSEFLTLLAQDKVIEVTIKGNNIFLIDTNGERFNTYVPEDPELVKTIREKGIKIIAQPEEDAPWMTILISWFPMFLLIAVWIFFMRQVQGGGGKAMSFGKSKARLL